MVIYRELKTKSRPCLILEIGAETLRVNGCSLNLEIESLIDTRKFISDSCELLYWFKAGFWTNSLGIFPEFSDVQFNLA